MEVEDFIEHITYLCMAYNKEFNEEQCMVWYDNFKQVKSENLARAIKKIIKANKFYPTIAELLEECEKVESNYQSAIVEKMINDGYFHNHREIEKAYHFIETGLIPKWFLKDMKKYGYQNSILLSNNNVKEIEKF